MAISMKKISRLTFFALSPFGPTICHRWCQLRLIPQSTKITKDVQQKDKKHHTHTHITEIAYDRHA